MARQINIELVGEAGRFQQTLAQSESKLERFGKRAQDVGRKMSTFVTLPVLGAGVAAFKMAGDFGESFSKMNTVFGESAKDIDAWSRTASTAMGLSRKEAIDAAGTFGNMFTQIGIGAPQAAALSTQMIQLAADLGSFHNADITDVIEAQTSAFRGEYDALQKYIPTINAATVEQKALEMTGKKTTAELTAQEKALAVQKLMMQGAGAAAGDFGRTSESAANQQRILTAQFKDAATELGTKLIPIGQQLLAFLTDLVGKFNGLSPAAQDNILKMAAFAAAIGPVAYAVGGLTKGVHALSASLTFLAAHPVVAFLVALAATLENVNHQWKAFKKEADAGELSLRQFVKSAMSASGLGVIDRLLGGKLSNVIPGRQHGGPVTAGRPYIVGERRPELFVPNQSGRILAGAGGGSTTVNLVLDGRVVTQVVLDGLLREQRSGGALGLS